MLDVVNVINVLKNVLNILHMDASLACWALFPSDSVILLRTYLSHSLSLSHTHTHTRKYVCTYIEHPLIHTKLLKTDTSTSLTFSFSHLSLISKQRREDDVFSTYSLRPFSSNGNSRNYGYWMRHIRLSSMSLDWTRTRRYVLLVRRYSRLRLFPKRYRKN